MKLYPRILHRRESEAQQVQPQVEMNTTPLIDVMLVLIVMLIITIPAQLSAVSLDLPSTLERDVPAFVQVHVNADGSVQWDAELMSDVQVLQTRLTKAAASNPQPEIHILAEADTPYAFVVSMTVLAQKMGFRRVGVVSPGF